MPLFRATRLDTQQTLRHIACLVIGVLILAGPYIALRGGLGTKPGIARVLALAPQSGPHGLEREKPLTADQPALQTYRLATLRMFKILRVAVTPFLFPFALFGLLKLFMRKQRLREASFLIIVLGASAIALVRLHATGGYGVTRHGAIPGIVLTVAAAGALASLVARCRIPGRWLGIEQSRVAMPAPVWSVLLAGLLLVFNSRTIEFANSGPFSLYHATATWLARNVKAAEQVLDMTDWSLYFSRRRGYQFADVYKAPGDPATRWIVVRGPHIEGRWPYSQVIRELIGGRDPVAVIPAHAAPGQLQIRVYERNHPFSPSNDRTAESSIDGPPTKRLRRPPVTSLGIGTQIAPARSRDQGNGS
jgi:hypothetical protein